jgi:hypothetical protein
MDIDRFRLSLFNMTTIGRASHLSDGATCATQGPSSPATVMPTRSKSFMMIGK